jgi:hypothetical protein
MNDAQATDEDDADSLKEHPVTAVGYSVICQGISNPAAEERLVTYVRTVVDIFSQMIDLSDLDGITIAADYPAALANLDRGYPTNHVLTATTEGASGVAMSPLVKRNGTLKTHIVLDAAFMVALLDPAAPHHTIARMTLAHECVHVYEHSTFDKAFPGFLLQKTYTEVREWLVLETARACWAEYLACRFSAWARPEHLAFYEEVFCTALKDCDTKVEAAFADYGLDHDGMKLAVAVGKAYSFLLKYGAYLVGHLAGTEQELTAAPAAAAALAGHAFAPYVAKLDSALAAIAAKLKTWGSIEEMWPPGEILVEILAGHGIHFKEGADGQSSIVISIP